MPFDIYWMSSLTMEETFLVTGLALLVIGGAFLGAMCLFGLPKDIKNDDEETEEDEE